jgi:hypothetical protein
MSLLRSAWLDTLAEQLFTENEFLNYCLNWDAYARAGFKDVTIPQSGAGSEVVRNRNVFPATVTERTDGDIKFEMNHYSATPRRVRGLTTLQYSYPYRESILRQDSAIMKQMVAEDILYSWRAEQAKFIIPTSGDAVAASVNSTATGQRKKATLQDLLTVEKVLTDAFIPKAGRIGIISTQTKIDLLTDTKIEDTFIAKDLANYKEGEIVRVAGFQLIVRPTVLVYNGAGTLAKLPGAAGATTDNDASLFWHPNYVGKAMGNTEVYYNAGRAEHYGDLFSSETYAGGSKYYADGTGVVALVQKPI